MNARTLVVAVPGILVVASVPGAAWFFQERETALKLPGIVEIQEVRPGPRIAGRVKRVRVAEGEVVAAGQPLVELDAPEWEAKRAQSVALVALARAQLDRAHNGALPEERAEARAAREVAVARLARLENGNRVEEIQAARQEYEALKAEEERARRDWQRETQLLRQSATSPAQADAFEATHGKVQNLAKAARERWLVLSKGARDEDVAEAQAEVAKTSARFELLDRGTRPEEVAEAEARLAEAQARLQEAERMLAEAVVVAPGRALVEVVSVRPGDTVTVNQPVVPILSAEDLWVKAYVAEPDLGRIRLNQEVSVTNDSFPGKKCRGVVRHIASTSEYTPRNVQSPDERHNQVFAIKVRLLESAEVFKSGMAAEVEVPPAPATAPVTEPGSY